MYVPVCMYACVCVGEKQIFLLSSYYFELTRKNLQNNSFQLLKGKYINCSQILDINIAV